MVVKLQKLKFVLYTFFELSSIVKELSIKRSEFHNAVISSSEAALKVSNDSSFNSSLLSKFFINSIVGYKLFSNCSFNCGSSLALFLISSIELQYFIISSNSSSISALINPIHCNPRFKIDIIRSTGFFQECPGDV